MGVFMMSLLILQKVSDKNSDLTRNFRTFVSTFFIFCSHWNNYSSCRILDLIEQIALTTFAHYYIVKRIHVFVCNDPQFRQC